MILFSHPTGNANVRYAAAGLQKAGLLGEFWTCLSYQDNRLAEKYLPPMLIRQLKRRAYSTELLPYMRTAPFRELGRLLASRAGLSWLVQHEKGLFSVDAIYRALDRKVSHRVGDSRFKAVYAYEDGAEFTFREASKRGLRKFYDLPIGYWRTARKLLTEEAELEPEWAGTIIGNRDSEAKTRRKDAELAMADVIFAASSFTRETLKDAGDLKARIEVIPYGAPLTSLSRGAQARRTTNKLRVLFVGSLGQRKGLSYLFRACRELRSIVDLTIIGTRPLVHCPALDRELAAVRWISTCPQSEVLEEMANHDVFVFPSLFEGFGLVLLEAMAMGMPIIATPHTAGPDLIQDGVEGFIVPIRSTESIVARLSELHANPDLLRTMSEKATIRAREFTWENYGATLAAGVREALEPASAPDLGSEIA